MQGDAPQYPVHSPPGEDVTHGQDTEDEDLGRAALFQEKERPDPSAPAEVAVFQKKERPDPSALAEVAAINPTTRLERSAQGTTPNDWPWETYDLDQMRKLQQEDKDIVEFLAYWEANVEKPKYGEIATRSPEFKTYWAQWERLQLNEGTLPIAQGRVYWT